MSKKLSLYDTFKRFIKATKDIDKMESINEYLFQFNQDLLITSKFYLI